MRATLSNPIQGLIVALSMFSMGAAPAPTVTSEAPEVLPEVTVSAGVPLIKVAEFQMRERRHAPAAVAHNGLVYIIGGLINTGIASDSIERFDPRTGRSEIIAHLQGARMWHRAVVVGDKIFVLGGAKPYGSSGVDLRKSVEIFDLTTGTVSSGPDMPEPRSQFACVEAGGQIFAIGGRQYDRGIYSFTDTTAVLDIANNLWRQGGAMPRPRAADGVVLDDGSIVVAGGYDGTVATDAVDVFDLHAGTWRTIKRLCSRTSAHATVLMGNYLFLFGDYGSPERLLAYNLKTRESETFTLRYTAARDTAVVAAGGRMYVIGGKVGKFADPLRLIQVFAPTSKPSPPTAGIPRNHVAPPVPVADNTVQLDSALHDELIAMAADDQRVRKNVGPGMSQGEREEMQRVDRIHQQRMEEIIAQHGWPGKSRVGPDGADSAWLVVQHCSPLFQEKCLPLLERAVAASEAAGRNYAYLLDRVRKHQGKPQVYGTQFRGYELELWPVEDPEHVDERRRAVGLGTLAEYLEHMSKRYPKPNEPAPAGRGSP